LKHLVPFIFIVLLCPHTVYAQEQNETTGDTWDIDSLWDSETFFEDKEEIPDENSDGKDSGNKVIKSIQERLLLEASYRFMGGFSPGWLELPWLDRENDLSYALGVQVDATLGVDFQLTDNLRVRNSFTFSIPNATTFKLNEFYFDYNLSRIIFLKAGMYGIAWGISRNFPYANLPARIPANKGGDAYLAKLEIPIMIGGLQLLALTRTGFMEDQASPRINEIAYGLKYNAAFPLFDIDFGAFYYEEMPLRSFLAVKTTLGNTEVYAEGLAATAYKNWDKVYLSGSAGFVQDFFGSKLTLNGEVFLNGEHNAAWYRENP
jgi:hypothetical protein